MRVAIIGAGPGGLTTLKHLLQAQKQFGTSPIEAQIFEAQDGVGGTYRYRAYPEGEMVSSKFLTTFSDFRIPSERSECGDFLTLAQYVDYLEDYCDHFNLRPNIRLNSKVTNIRRGKNGKGHVLTYTSRNGGTSEWTCDAVAICSGLHVQPVKPLIPGMERIPTVFHSSEYRGRNQFGEGTNVVILGVGETAMDMAYFAVTSPTKSVTLCHRNGFVLAPKDVHSFLVMGKPEPENNASPIDTNWNSLFDSAYVHPKLRQSPWLWVFYDWWTKLAWMLLNGTRYGYGQHVGIKKGYHMSEVIFVKSTKAQPYFNPRYIKETPILRFKRKIIDLVPLDTKGRSIDFAPFPRLIDEDGRMHFEQNDTIESKHIDTMTVKPDVLVYATGYSHLRFPYLSADYPHSNEADVRAIWKDGDETVGFIGFVRPQLGAIPPLAELQAQLWILRILNQLPRSSLENLSPVLNPDVQNWYKLNPEPDARVKHGVDHESYAYQLALDMKSAPSIFEMMSFGMKVFLVWAFGANFGTKFTLVGPWQSDKAVDIMEGELWDIWRRRPFFWGHLMLNVLPMVIFGPLSLLYWIYYTFWDIVGNTFNKFLGRLVVKWDGEVLLGSEKA